MYQLPELLVPSGDREQFESALLYGADAVYLGGHELSLRSKCHGFDENELRRAVLDAHAKNVKVYYCLNAMPYDSHLRLASACLEMLPDMGIDGLIAADPGIIRLAKRICPQIEIHLSTQAHSSNSEAISFWIEAGIKRINLARELNLIDIRRIIKKFPDIDFEIFVHGAMCLALSGHCLLSAWLNQRSANLGLCTQPCRFEYKACDVYGLDSKPKSDRRWLPREDAKNKVLIVEEAKREGEALWHISEDVFSGIWAPDDICLMRYLPWIMHAGVRSLKLEGRTKSGGYVAQLVDAYRSAIDFIASEVSAVVPEVSGADGRKKREGKFLPNVYIEELLHVSSRPLSSGFFLPHRKIETVKSNFSRQHIVARLIAPVEGRQHPPHKEKALLASTGKMSNSESWHVQIRGPWRAENNAYLLLPGMNRPLLQRGKYVLENHKGEISDCLHPGMTGIVHGIPEGAMAGAYIRS